MKKFYYLILLFSMFGWSQTTIFSENMGNVTATTLIPAHVTANGFQNSATLTYSSGTITDGADIRNTNASSGYTNASAGANVFFSTASSAVARGFAIESINASTYTNLQLQFAYRKESATVLPALVVDYWNGTQYVNIPFTFNETASAAIAWYLTPVINLPVDAQINGLKLRWVRSTGGTTTRIDDVVLAGTPTTPSLSTTPTAVSGLNYIINAGPSTSQSFGLTGANLTGGAVTVALPVVSNFEISETINGTYSSSISLAAFSGTLTTIFVRLKQGLAIANYNDIITISGGGASTNVNVAGKVVEEIFLIYEFTNNSLVATQTPDDAVTTDFQVSSDLLAFGTAQPETWTGSGVPYTNSQAGWAATNAASAKNFFFNVTPNANFNINATAISFQYRATGNGPSGITVEINGNVIETFNVPADVTSVFTKPLNLQNLPSLQVKIYGWNNASRTTDGSGFLRVDDVRINGETFNTLSSNDFNITNTISLYPNPSSNGNVSIKSNLNGLKNIQMFDISGREVLNTTIQENSFNVNGFNSGVYLVKITSENKSFTTKLIIK